MSRKTGRWRCLTLKFSKSRITQAELGHVIGDEKDARVRGQGVPDRFAEQFGVLLAFLQALLDEEQRLEDEGNRSRASRSA